MITIEYYLWTLIICHRAITYLLIWTIKSRLDGSSSKFVYGPNLLKSKGQLSNLDLTVQIA